MEKRMSSLDKMLSLLDMFDEEHMWLELETVVKKTGISTPTAYRYIQSLCAAGLLVPSSSGRYILGSRIIELDRLMRRNDPLIAGSSVPMRETSASLNLNIMLCSYYGDNVMCVDIVWPDSSVPLYYERGRAMPMLRGAMAKVILANLSHYQLRKLYDWHAEAIDQINLGSDWDSFRTSMAKIKADGHCVTRAEVFKGLIGCAAPIFDAENRILGSIVFIVTEERFDAETETILVPQIKSLSERITACIRKLVASDQLPGVPAARPRRFEVLPPKQD